MTFKSWKIWYKQLPLSLKWFVILILLRPIIDQFYFLKNISILISPLYIVGFLTPVLIGLSFLSKKFPPKLKSLIIDSSFSIWTGLVVLNFIFLFFIDPDLGTLGNIFKLITPFLLFFYSRHFIRNKYVLNGVLTTILYSTIFPATLLLYEFIFEPINAEYLTESRGGGARYSGGYADIMNYAIFISAALLIKGYFFIKNSSFKSLKFNQWIVLFLILVICFFGLVGIKQTASWMVAAFLVGLFLTFNLKSVKAILAGIFVIPILFVIGSYTYEEKIQPLIEKEIQVLDGEKDIERSFNGRMGRWINFFETWSEMPIASNFIGVATSGKKEAIPMTGGIVHNEYIRILFLSGILGLILFLVFIFNLSFRLKYLQKPEKFLVIGAIGTFLLFSISTTPLNYAPMAYYIFPIFAYASLPKIILKLDGKT